MLIYNGHIGDVPALETRYLGAYCSGKLVQAAINSLVWMATLQGVHTSGLSEACDPTASSSIELVHNGLWYLCNIFCNVLGVGRGFLCAVPPFLIPKERVSGSLWTIVRLHASIAARCPLAVFLPFITSIICFISLSCTWLGNLMFCLFF